jgi:drug/metabolite transporter (DMT)-like permease
MGELAAVANAIVWALTGVVTKGVGKNVRPTHIVAAQVWIGLAFLLTVGFIVGQIDELINVELRSAIYLAGGAVINTAGSLVFWLALSRGTVSTVYPTTQSIFISISVFAGWLFLDDEPQMGVIGGAILIIAGVILLNLRPADEPATEVDSAPGPTGQAIRQRTTKKFRGDYIGIGLGVTTSFLWAGGFLSTVVGLEETPPVAAATIRNLVPAILFVGVAIFFPTHRVTRVFRANGIRLTVGAMMFALSALTFVIALDNAPPSVVVVLVNTSPMWAVVFAAIALRERLTRFALGGALLSMAGIFVTLAFR